jgi:peptidoglycan/xylan/chitin deacetylase (PgdA/CDA1 family)
LRNNGTFTISLDFELFWGVRDKRSIEDYRENLLGVWIVIPKILRLFRQYNIHATWATVGFLFCEDFKDLKNKFPTLLPKYHKEQLSPYLYIEHFKDNEINLKVHFARELIEIIKNTPNQEIASHTFSHFYTHEENSEKNSFDSDSESFLKISKENNIDVKSIVFPRNQVDEKSIRVVKKYGITIYRGNPEHWAYRYGDTKKDFRTKVVRFLDTYWNLTGFKTSLPTMENGCYNVKSSMFLRPYNKKFMFLEKLKLRRIKQAMLYAAKKGENFHLWWHPHNFGINQEKNLQNLQEILRYYDYLHKMYNFESKTMKELVHG